MTRSANRFSQRIAGSTPRHDPVLRLGQSLNGLVINSEMRLDDLWRGQGEPLAERGERSCQQVGKGRRGGYKMMLASNTVMLLSVRRTSG